MFVRFVQDAPNVRQVANLAVLLDVMSDCPPEWLEEGHTEEEWNNLDYDSQKDFATEHGYKEENHDPPSEFVSPSLEDLDHHLVKIQLLHHNLVDVN